MDLRYLTAEEILGLHALEVGEGVGLRDLNLLEAAVAQPRQSAFGDDARAPSATTPTRTLR